jgi:hypothetical protein
MFVLMMVDGNKFCGVFSSREKAFETARQIKYKNPKDTDMKDYGLVEGFYVSPVVLDEFDNYTW